MKSNKAKEAAAIIAHTIGEKYFIPPFVQLMHIDSPWIFGVL